MKCRLFRTGKPHKLLAGIFWMLGLLVCAEGRAQTYLPNKGIIWELNQPQEPRLKFRFGTSGINIGGYEGTTLIIENVSGQTLNVDTKLTVTDFCGTSKTYNVRATLKPGEKIGGSTWMGGSEQNDYSTPCKERKEYDKNYVTKLANATLELVSVKEAGAKPKPSGTSGSATNSGSSAGNSGGNASGSGNATPAAGNTGNTSDKPCPVYGFKLANKPTYNCVALDWWSLSTKTNTMDAAGNFSQQGGPDAVKFTVQFRKQGDVVWTSEVRANTGKNTHEITGLDACTKYEVRLITTCENNVSSDPTNIVRFTTACNAPNTPTAADIRDRSANLNFGRQTENAFPCDPNTNKVLLVEYRTGTTTWQEMHCNPGVPCELNALSPGTIYLVRSRYKYGPNLYSNYTNEVSFTTTGTAPNPCGGNATTATPGQATGTLAVPQPTGPPDAKKVYGYYVELSWTGVLGATGYELQVATKPDFSDAVLFKTTNTSYPPSNYGSAKQYYWRVRAKGPDGKISYWSPVVSFLVN